MKKNILKGIGVVIVLVILGLVLSVYWAYNFTETGIAYRFIHAVDEGHMSEAYSMFTSRLQAEETEEQWTARMNKVKHSFLWNNLTENLLFTSTPYENSSDQWIVSNGYMTSIKGDFYTLEFKVINDKKAGYKIDETYDLSAKKEWNDYQPDK